jgi:hypothetical protein
VSKYTNAERALVKSIVGSLTIKRDPNDLEITKGGKTGADTPEAREKLRKSGMTKL